MHICFLNTNMRNKSSHINQRTEVPKKVIATCEAWSRTTLQFRQNWETYTLLCKNMFSFQRTVFLNFVSTRYSHKPPLNMLQTGYKVSVKKTNLADTQ